MFPKTKENKLFYKFKNKKYFVRYTIGIIKISFKYLETIIIKIFVWIFLRDKYSFNLKIEDKSTDFSSYVYLYDENIKVFKK